MMSMSKKKYKKAGGGTVDTRKEWAVSMKLTELEKKVVDAYKKDDIVSDGGWENGSPAWVEGFMFYEGMDGKTFAGVMSSLKKKRIIWTNGEAFGLTAMGIQVARDI